MTQKTNKKSHKLILIIIILLFIAAGAGAAWWFLHQNNSAGEGGFGEGGNAREPIYSKLTGLEITDASLNSSPTFCVQIPNGSTDGARPQAGLRQAGIVFEAIAETGITRFAAIFQNPNTGVIGPIRSLRPYYLDWDTPFDCTIVHDGGSPEALAAVGNGSYRNLDEDFDYMWKVNDPSRLWNNVFTSPEKLLNFNQKHNYNTSNPKTFPRLEPEALADLSNQKSNCSENTTEDCNQTDQTTQATTIRTVFTNLSDYIVNYTYDPADNTYKRSYEGTGAHLVYDCPTGISDLTQCGEPIQVSPSAVAVMRVQEHTMSDNYHESIQTIGQGTAYIFQNGEVIEGTWQKKSQNQQIEFRNQDGTEIKFVPGQLWIAAVPQFGNVSWE